MDILAFSEFKSGRLVPMSFHGKPDHAFIPNPLPPAVGNDRFWPLLLEASKKLERLSVKGDQLPDVNLLLRPLQRREALTSNSLEGTFVTPQELLLFEARESGSPKGEPGQRDDWREVFAYDQALRTGCEWIRSGQNIDVPFIQKLHLLLMNASARGKEKNPGQFRTTQVVVGADRRYIPPPPDELRASHANLEAYMTTPPVELNPLLAAYIAHYQFEAIHPFQDGNGRIGRLILSLCIYKWLGLQSPCLYMSEFFEKHRKDYISHLFRISTHGEWDDWLEFCLKGTIEQATASIQRCDALESLRKRYEALLGSIGGRAMLLLGELFKSPFITVGEVKEKFAITYRPAKTYLEKLTALGILIEMKNQYPKTFMAKEIFDTAYGAD